MNDIQDDLTIQRCVDGELSDAQRAELLQRLHSANRVEHWRTLALSFIENQVLGLSFREAELPHALPQSAHNEAPEPWYRRRMSIPTSLAAALTVGVLSGLLGHYSLQRSGAVPDNPPGGQMIAQAVPAPAMSSPAELAAMRNVGSPRSNAPTPMMNVHLTGLGNSREPVSVPVYSPEQYPALPLSQSGSLVPEAVRRQLESEGLKLNGQQQWYHVRLPDGRDVYFPTETVQVHPAVQ
jgi:hypothetical protein